MVAQVLVQTLAARGIRLSTNGQSVIVEPASRLTDDDRAAIRAHKSELVQILSDPVSECLEIIRRLKGYTLASARMPAAQRLFQLLKPVTSGELHPVEVLHHLRGVERELIRLGGAFDPELDDAVNTITEIFPGAKLVH